MAFNKTKALKQADKYIAKQNYNKALNELLKVVKVTPNDANLLNKVGDLYSKVGNTKSAIEYFTKVAESYQRGGFNLKAIALYKKIMRIDTSYMDARQRLVDLYIQQGHQSEAKGELRRMAEHYYNENLIPRALDCYEKLVQIEPHNLDARLKITELLIKEGKRGEATGHFAAMGRELLDKTMINEARKILSQGLNIAPEDEGLQVLMTQCLIAEGKIDEALTRLTEICEKNEDNMDALHILGETYLKKGMLDEARACFLRGFALSGEDNGNLEELGRRYIDENRLDEAFECLEPLAEFFSRQKQFDEAVRLIRTILYTNDAHMPSQDILLHLYQQAGQKTNAVLTLEKIINFHLEAGNQDEARQRIESLLELDPNNIEWREKYRRMVSAPESNISSGHIEVYDQEPEAPPAVLTSSQGDDSGEDLTGIDIEDSVMESFEAGTVSGLDESESVQVANHLTEADVFMKYGVLDQAMTHLLEAQNLDPLNPLANSRLRDIYLKKGDVQSAILCMVRLINGAIEKRQWDQAKQHIHSIEQHRPDIARQHHERLQTLMNEDSSPFTEKPKEGEYSLDFGNSEEAAGLQIEEPPEADVVDFKDMNVPEESGFDLEADDEGGSWSLDMPDATLDGGGLGEDFTDLYNPAAQTISEGADELPDLAAIRAGFEDSAEEGHSEEPLVAEEPVAEPEPEHMPEPEPVVPQPEEDNTADFTDQIEMVDMTGGAPPDLEVDIGPPDTDFLQLPESELPAESLMAPIAEEETLPELAEEALPELEDSLIDDGELEEAPAVLEDTGFGMLEFEETGTDIPRPEGLSLPEEEPAPPLVVEPEPTPSPEIAPEPAEHHAPLQSSTGSLAGELEEIDFFISVEAYEDAEKLIVEARKHFGEHPLLLERVQELTSKTQTAPPEVPTFKPQAPQPANAAQSDDLLSSPGGSGFFDLAAELSEELFEDDAPDVNDQTSQEEIQSVEELFQEFKKGVDEQIDEGDHETHYDLGIAYKEMGLLEEAIDEFEKADNEPTRALDCATMIGQCLIELGRMDEAVAHFKSSLERLQAADQKVAIQYELALVYQNEGENEKALEQLMAVKAISPNYRDLEELIEALAI
ncbi:MAG: tetratricopeptide repeat protein [Acidobacteriota bacterium]|nr:tetratricopeptide repeat protein [Acidobacteriota bacterium]